ncbi:hypothetical protein QQY66_11345 [Streptomyces sp. DG2A-72]|nr:hypothetical protein [Streptomyces sp. DG2A-72]MDO0932255.1 hypothetical protein [Streptomyces sp. DG2A-72]
MVAGADLIALGALDAARALGLSVPDDRRSSASTTCRRPPTALRR